MAIFVIKNLKIKDMRPYILCFAIVFFFNLHLCAQDSLKIYCEQKRYTELEAANTDPKHEKYHYYKAVYANACKQSELSNRHLDSLNALGLSSDLLFDYWQLRNDNYIKLFDYAAAEKAMDSMLLQMGKQIAADSRADLRGIQALWAALRNELPQRIRSIERAVVGLRRDAMNLLELDVHSPNDPFPVAFIFDTGAGISCLNESTARRWGAKILPLSRAVRVSSFNGIKNRVGLALLPLIRIGDLEIENAFFLVYKDKDLLFSDNDYKINGIIGFPIIQQLGKLTFYADSLAVEPQPTSVPDADLPAKNLFIHFYDPIVLLQYEDQTLPFSFDTGASTSTLYYSFWERFYESSLKNKDLRGEWRGSQSAGGTRSFKAVVAKDLDFNLNGTPIRLPEVEIMAYTPSFGSRALYGNLGQDILQGHKAFVLNFQHNYLKLLKE